MVYIGYKLLSERIMNIRYKKLVHSNIFRYICKKKGHVYKQTLSPTNLFFFLVSIFQTNLSSYCRMFRGGIDQKVS